MEHISSDTVPINHSLLTKTIISNEFGQKGLGQKGFGQKHRIRKSISFHLEDIYRNRVYSSPPLLKINTNLSDNERRSTNDPSNNTDGVWNKMDISPTKKNTAISHFEMDVEMGNQLLPPNHCDKQIVVMYSCYQRGKQWILKYHIEFINVSLCVLLHVFIMIVFEIYFYFNYVIEIERAAFLDKIDDYFRKTQKYQHPEPILALYPDAYNNWLNTLYADYMSSKSAQAALLHHLLQKACEMGGAFGIVLVANVFLALYYYKQIRWKTIMAENVAMLGLLGFFEYLFFTHIIMNYNPISDAELEYIIAKQAYNIFINNGTTITTIGF